MATKKIILRSALVLFGLGLGGLAAEGLLRLFGAGDGRAQGDLFEAGEGRGDHLAVVLGDSFIEKRNPLFKMILGPLLERGVRVLDLARPGIGPYEYFIYFKMVGAPARPKTVALFYYAGNDLTDVLYRRSGYADLDRVIDEMMGAFEVERNKARVTSLLGRASALFRGSGFDFEEMLAAGIDPTLVAKARRGEVNPWLLKIAARHPRYLFDNLMIASAEARATWSRIETLLANIDRECHELGARFVVIAFPHCLQVNDSRLDFLGRCRFELGEELCASRRPQELLGAFCRRRKIPFLDLLPVLEAARGELYRPEDDHLSEEGCRQLREPILEFLCEHTAIARAPAGEER